MFGLSIVSEKSICLNALRNAPKGCLKGGVYSVVISFRFEDRGCWISIDSAWIDPQSLSVQI